MDTYHQLTLFDLEVYSSGPSCSAKSLGSQIEKFPKEVNFRQLELDFSPELRQLEYYSFERLSRAA